MLDYWDEIITIAETIGKYITIMAFKSFLTTDIIYVSLLFYL